MTFMNKEDPADPDPPTWPAWATVLGILLIGGIVALGLVYRGGGDLLGLDDAGARMLVVAALATYGVLMFIVDRRRRAPQRPS